MTDFTGKSNDNVEHPNYVRNRKLGYQSKTKNVVRIGNP